MLTFNLTPIFKTRGIEKPYSFLVKAGFSKTVARKIAVANPRVLRLDHVELLCKLLLCDPNDLLLWTPDKGQVYPQEFPLSRLNSFDAGENNWRETIDKIPLKQLKEVKNTILNKPSEPGN